MEWTRSDDGDPDGSGNPITGCTEVSHACGRLKRAETAKADSADQRRKAQIRCAS